MFRAFDGAHCCMHLHARLPSECGPPGHRSAADEIRLHAIVVIGVGLDAAWPFAAFSLSFDEYLVENQNIAGNCLRYNHIAVTRPSRPAKVAYFGYKVPACTYVYSSFNSNADLAQPASGSAFIAPPGRTVYFGDYVFVGNRTVEWVELPGPSAPHDNLPWVIRLRAGALEPVGTRCELVLASRRELHRRLRQLALPQSPRGHVDGFNDDKRLQRSLLFSTATNSGRCSR